MWCRSPIPSMNKVDAAIWDSNMTQVTGCFRKYFLRHVKNAIIFNK